jgi:hypothetical protein
VHKLLFILAACLLLPAAYAGDPAADMTQAADLFLKSLNDEQKKEAQFTWKDDKRTGWYFVPDKYIKPDKRRYGLRMDAMKTHQRLMAHGLVASALSSKGVMQVSVIRTLEQVLHELENNNPIRQPDWYYVSIFGEPSTSKTWSWRFEGHHLSINITLVNGKHISSTPSFWASNPGTVKPGHAFAGLKTLAEEEDLARALIKSMSAEQRKKAVIMEKAPRDILTSAQRKVNKGPFDPNKGIGWSDLNKDQQTQLKALVAVYTGKYRPELIAHLESRGTILDPASVKFAWGGGLEPGQGHYYRVQTAKYLFEYDNVQNNAAHVHAVWRDFDGDFGEDLLRLHHEQHHK